MSKSRHSSFSIRAAWVRFARSALVRPTWRQHGSKTTLVCSLVFWHKFRGGEGPRYSRLTAAMQHNALPQPWATPDRSRSMSDNVQFHSSSGRLNRPQAPAMATWSHHESIGSEELAARQHSACHAGPSGRVNNLLNLNSCNSAPSALASWLPVGIGQFRRSGSLFLHYICLQDCHP